MTTTRTESDPFIQLSLIINPVVHEHLTPLDTDADGKLVFEEVAHRTVFTPSDESAFVFSEKDDINRYNRLIDSSANAFVFTRFRNQYPRPGRIAPRAEAWLADAGESLLDAAPLYMTNYNGVPSFYLWDMLNSPGEDVSLLMEYHGYLPALPGFFFTLRFPADTNDIEVTIGDATYPLDRPFTDGREVWRASLLECIYITMVDYLKNSNAFFTPFQFERVEALMIKANSYLTDFYDRPKPKKDALPQELATRTEIAFKGTLPERGKVALMRNGVAYELSILSLDPVTRDDLARLQKALDALPQELKDALGKNGFLDGPKQQRFHFVPAEVMRAGGYGGALAINQSAYHIITFNLNAIRRFTTGELKDVLVHELAHTILPPEMKSKTFVPEYYEGVKTAFTTTAINPAVSPYGLSGWCDFFAESVVAYFNGENDPAPWVAVGTGPRSRMELRGKQPELYVALRLFFDASSPFFGDLYCFSQDTFALISRLLASDARSLALDPATLGEIPAKLVHLLSLAKKCRATKFEQRMHDPFHGDFHNIFVYDSGIDLEGDGTDERVMIEEKVSYDTPGQRWNATLRIVVLKKTTDGRVARLTSEVSVGGPLSVEDFMAYGVEPIFGGLYVVNSQGRDFLRVRSRLGWNADFHVLEDDGGCRLVKHVNRLP